MSGCAKEMRERNPKLAKKFEKQFGEDIFDRAPRPPEDFFERRPRKPSFDIEKSWWVIVKAVDIDFTFLTSGRQKEAMGWYNPVTDDITINLYPWRKGNRGAKGKKTTQMTDQDFIDEIIETITHEAGHAAALSEQGADLHRELHNWASDVIFQNIDVSNMTRFQSKAADILQVIVNYLVNEYVADLIAGENKEQALQNAWTQTVIARADEWLELLMDSILEEEATNQNRGRLVNAMALKLQNDITGFFNANPFTIVEEVLPLLDKHFNKINETLFKIYQTGVSRTVQSNWEQYTDEETREQFGHDFPFARTQSKKDEIFSSPDWED